MPRRRRNTRRNVIKKAEIGYFDGEIHTVAFNDGDTVSKLIEKANLNFGEGQSINDEKGEDIKAEDKAVNNKTYYITGNYKQG